VVAVLVAQQRFVHVRTEKAPVVVAELEGRLRAVINRIEEVRRAPARQVFEQVRSRLERLLTVVQLLAAQLQAEDAGAGAGDGEAAAPGGVAKTAGVGVLATLEVLDRLVDGLRRHVAAEVLRGAQGHQLPAGDADVAAVHRGYAVT